jgi:hypothetical protein
MMKHDLDIDTEKYSGHNSHNNMFIKTFYVPDDIKKNAVSPVAKINFMAASHDAAPSPGDERKPTQTVCAAYRFPIPWGFIAGRDAIRRWNGVMGHCVLKKISYYTFPPTRCKLPSLNYKFPPPK